MPFYVSLVAFLAGYLLAGLLYQFGHEEGLPYWAQRGLSFLGLWAPLLSAALLSSGTRSPGLALLKVRPSAGDLVLGLVAGVGGQFVFGRFIYLPLYYADPKLFKHLGDPSRQLLLGHGRGSQVAVAFYAVALAPIVEELFFRAAVYTRLREVFVGRWGRWGEVLAVLASAALFAGAHIEPLQFAGLFLLGVVLAVLLARTGTVWVPITAHVAFNLTAVVLLLA